MPGRPIREIIRGQYLIFVSPLASVREAACKMRDHNTGSVLVIENEELIGIFTERDALNRVLAAGLDPDATPVESVMTSDPITITPDRPVVHALHMMQEGGYRHLPVAIKGRPLGMVSIRDAMALELLTLEQEVEHKQHLTEIIA